MALVAVALCFAMNMLARGLGESFALFLLPVTQELGWSRSAFSSVYAVYMVTTGVCGILAGALFDRFGARAVYAPALTMFGAGLLIASEMTSLWQAVLGLGLLGGAGIAGTGMAIGAGLIARWFRRDVTLAMALAYAGLSVGMITIAPLVQVLIEAQGWRAAYRWMGLSLLALAPLLAATLPWARLSGGRPGLEAPARSASLLVPRAVLLEPAFQGMFWSFFLTSVSTWSMMLQAVAYMVERGVAPLAAAIAYGAVGALSVFGMVGTGWLADRHGRRPVVTASYALSIAGVAILWSLPQDPPVWTLGAFVLVFGVTMGARGPVYSSLTALLWPGRVGAVYGAITLGFGLGSAAGGLLSGVLHDLTGGYSAVFALSIGAAALAATPFWTLRPLATGRRD
ncbi:MAG: MFS transporter [Pseudomonadota bacterium]